MFYLVVEQIYLNELIYKELYLINVYNLSLDICDPITTMR